MLRTLSLLAFLLFSSLSFGQGFRVKSFKLSKSDDLAAISPRTDKNGRTCGLVKVSAEIDDLEFIGAVGKVTRSLDEYWVYLSDGAESITIMRPHYLPTIVRFGDYGTGSIMTKTTYVMELKESDLNMEKCGVMIHVLPASAQVKIDGVMLKANPEGDYQLMLPKGNHTCEFSAYGCRDASRTVVTGSGAQRMELELESILAELTINSQTEGAELLINDEMKGTSNWTGKLLPGEYKVEHRMKGYLPASQTITLAEKETRTLDLGALDHIRGSFAVTTVPAGCLLWLDDEGSGKAPCDVSGVIFGRHILVAEVDSCGLKRRVEMPVKVEEVGSQEVTIRVATDQELEQHREALEVFCRGFVLDTKGMSASGYYPQPAAKAPYDSIMDRMDVLDSSFFVHKVFFPEYEADAIISPNQCIGENLFKFYTYVDINDDEPVKLKSNPKYFYIKQPDKALRVAGKMGKQLSRHEMAWVANAFYRNGNYEQSIQWFRRWFEQGQAQGDEEDYYAGRCYLCWGDAYKHLGQSTDAREWLDRAIAILEKTEKKPAQLKKFRQIAKEN